MLVKSQRPEQFSDSQIASTCDDIVKGISQPVDVPERLRRILLERYGFMFDEEMLGLEPLEVLQDNVYLTHRLRSIFMSLLRRR